MKIVLITNVDNMDRSELPKEIFNSNYGTLENLKQTVKTTEKKYSTKIELMELKEFIDSCNNQTFNIEENWVTVVTVKEKTNMFQIVDSEDNSIVLSCKTNLSEEEINSAIYNELLDEENLDWEEKLEKTAELNNKIFERIYLENIIV